MFIPVYRPGYFGRRRDEKIAELNARYGEGNWDIRWQTPEFPGGVTFNEACILYYEWSYISWFRDKKYELDFVCSYGECIDNAITNIDSGRDYRVQEAFSTHIQDIAIRNVLFMFARRFEGPKDKILVIRSADSEGYKYGPGNIPFCRPDIILQPSLAPKWAKSGSVEDFWQSNKYIFVNDKSIDTPVQVGR